MQNQQIDTSVSSATTNRMGTGKAIAWSIATILTPLAFSFFFSSICIGSWFAMKAATGQPHQGEPPASVVQTGVLLGLAPAVWATVGLWWWFNRKRDSFSTLFNTRTREFGGDVLIGLAIGIAWTLVYGSIGWPPFDAMFEFDLAKMISLPASLSAGFCEEFLFRGFVIWLIAQAGGSQNIRVIGSSAAFGLAHIWWGPVGMIFTMFLGASFAIVTIRRGNVWSAAVAHTFLNLCIEPGMFEKAMGYQY